MGLFDRFRSKSTTASTASPTFMPVDWVNAFLSGELDTPDKKLLGYYLRVPELQAIINYRAQVFASMIVRMRRIDSKKEVEKHNILDLLQNPNPIQNFEEFAQQASIQKDIFGNGYSHPIFGTDPSNSQAIWNLPSCDAEIIPSTNITSGKGIVFNQTEVEEIIKEYQFEYFQGQITYPPEEVIHFNDIQIRFDKEESDYLKGLSKINALTQACENIVTAYEARGILQGNSPMGIIANQTKDQMGTTPMNPDDKKEVQEKMRKQYGLSRKKWQYLVTNASLDFISMAVDINKLRLFEEVNEDQGAIADAYSFPIEIFQPGTTFANKEQAKKQLYQDSIIPEATNWLQMLSKGLGLIDKGLELFPDFSEVPVMQDDLEKRTKMWNTATMSVDRIVKLGGEANFVYLSNEEVRDILKRIGMIKEKKRS
jgi:phage portal protein BeeE